MTTQNNALLDLWKNYGSTGRSEYRDELIVNYLFLVKYVVSRVAVGLPTYVKMDDLYSSGVTGLIRAVEKYDLNKNAKFESYAILLIKGAIIDELRELDWIPRSVHQKANQIASAQSVLQQNLGREPTDEELSTHLGMECGEFEDLLTRVRPCVLIPLNGDVIYNEEETTSLSERIADKRQETSFDVATRHEVQQMLEKAIAELPEQERRVLMLYYFEEKMLKEIGTILGVSESRVSQIHTKAILKLRYKLSEFMTLA